MAGKTIEDILINKDYKKIEKKKKSNIFIIIFLGLLIAIVAVLGYFLWRHIENSKIVTAKDMFLEYVVDSNLNNIIQNDLYKESFKKLGTDNFYMDTGLNFSTTSEIEGFENFDFSKFSIDNNLVSKVSEKKVYTNSMIKYLGNDIFDLKTISQSNNFAINSEQIVTKYISGNTDQMNNLIKEVTGYDFNVNFGVSLVDGIINAEEIEITDKNIENLKKNFVKVIDSNIQEDDVTQKEIIIESNGEQVSTVAYTAVIDKKEVLKIANTLIEELEDDKIISKILTGYENTSIFDVGEQKKYETNPEVDLENIIDSSEFIVGAESNTENVIENVVEESVGGTINSSTVENEDLEYREGIEDETVLGYEPPVVNENNNNNSNNNNNNNNSEDSSGEVINIVNPNQTQNNNSNNSSSSNNSNSGSNNNSLQNTVLNNTTNNTVNNNVQNNVNNSNTGNRGNNISSDIVVDNNTSNNGGTVIPIASLIDSTYVTVKSGLDRKFLSDIQIIQNPNLTTDEDKQAQEENRELLKEETEELFSSITDAIESNAQIVNENIETNSENASEFGIEFELIKCVLFKTKMNVTYDKYKEKLEALYQKLVNHNFESLYVTVYVADENTLKLIIEDNNLLQIEIDYINVNDAESKIKFLKLDNKELRTGNMIEIYKSQREAACSYDTVVSWIEEGKIVEKITATISSKGTTLGNTLDNDLILKYVKGKDESFQVSVNNLITFASKDIEKLNSDNCLYLNSLSNEEYVAIINAVKNKTMDVLSEKMTDLDLIDLNTGNDFVNRVQEEAENNMQEENNISKDNARNLIIERVSILMGEAEARGENVTLDVVRDLTIDGYEVSSTVSNEEAYIVLNGHKFIIDSGFTIIDVN